MKLYGSLTSPYVRHARIAIAQSGFQCEFEEADYARSAELSPTARVPFFEDGDLMLTDSSSILKYVREKAGTGFLLCCSLNFKSSIFRVVVGPSCGC